MKDIFDPISLGGKMFSNRLFMAPCTRNRASMKEVPTPIMIDYYAQRATAGIIISEGINPEPRGRGYYRVPAAYNEVQQQSWAPIVQAVHANGGCIFGQLMHCGRLSFRELMPEGELPIAPSAIMPDPEFRGMSYGCPKPDLAYQAPRAIEFEEIPALIDSFASAAKRLINAGFDGVELHGGSGYLPMQFLTSNTNCRDDAYGGDIRRRSRFLLDVIDAMIGAVGAGRVACKLAPAFRFHDVHDEDPEALYTYVAQTLSNRGLAYVQVSDYGEYYSFPGLDPIGLIRQNYRGPLVANGGFSLETAQRTLADGKADAIAFGTAFIANPDLPERFKKRSPINIPDPSTFYTDGAKGYIDYPTLNEPADVKSTLQYGGTKASDLKIYQHGAPSSN